MSYVILDLEWNGSYSKVQHKFVNEIIEFGAVKTDDNFNIIDKFSTLISQKIGKRLCGKVKELTKLTNEELIENGIDFLSAVEKFRIFSENCVILTWGKTDIHTLIENMLYYTDTVELPFLQSYCDLQEYCEHCEGIAASGASQLGLSKCAEMCNINFVQEEQHRAFADAELSLKCLIHYIDKFSLEPFIVKVNEEFYKRIMFKVHYIIDIDSPKIDKSQMTFSCKFCGKPVNRTNSWKVHNHAFTADFYCNECDKKYKGRVSFKQQYDNLIIKKKLLPMQTKQENHEEIKTE